jgi:hypothetical protein
MRSARNLDRARRGVGRKVDRQMALLAQELDDVGARPQPSNAILSGMPRISYPPTRVQRPGRTASRSRRLSAA